MALAKPKQHVFELKKTHLIVSLVILLMEVAIALWVRDSFVRPVFGDFLVTILLYTAFRGVFAGGPLQWAVVAVGISFLVETLQAFRIVERLGLADCRIAAVLIGTSFSVTDLVAYSLGGGVALLIDTLVLRDRSPFA